MIEMHLIRLIKCLNKDNYIGLNHANIDCLFDTISLKTGDIIETYDNLYSFRVLNIRGGVKGQYVSLSSNLKHADNYIPHRILSDGAIFKMSHELNNTIEEPEALLDSSIDKLYSYNMDWRKIPF